MFNHHELLVMRLGNTRARLKKIREQELAEAELRIAEKEKVIHSEMKEHLEEAILRGVPVGKIREAVGARNWKTWARVKQEFGILNWNETDEAEGESDAR